MGAALHHLARDGDRVAAVMTVGPRSAAGIDRDATRLVLGCRMPGAKPVLGPFPDVADHVGQAEAVGRIGADRRGSFVAVRQIVLPGEFALPDIGHLASIRLQLITPGIFMIIHSGPCGIFPLRLGRQALARPVGISGGVGMGDVHHRVIHQFGVAAVRSKRMTPVGTEAEGPPVGPVGGVDGKFGRHEQQGAGLQHLGLRARIVLGIGRNLGGRDVARGVDEFSELTVGHGRSIDPEAADPDRMPWRLFGVMAIRSHVELAALDPDHVLRRLSLDGSYGRRGGHGEHLRATGPGLYRYLS
jgi:hypothetical protein